MKVLCIESVSNPEFGSIVKGNEYNAMDEAEHPAKKGVFGYMLEEFPPKSITHGFYILFTEVWWETKYFITLPDLSEEALEKEKQLQEPEKVLA